MNYMDLLHWLADNPALSFFILLAQYIVIMLIHMKAKNRALYTIMAIWFIPQDVVVNAVLFTALGQELPHEWTVTERMKRWKKLDGRKKAIADWLCNILNKYDEGHC